MIVTTARKQATALEQTARLYADQLQASFVQREDRSLEALTSLYSEDLLIVAKNKVMLYPLDRANPFFYHPNAALLRYKQWKQTGHDPFIEITGLKAGETCIDATLGMAADSIIAQLAVGETGTVIGLEANKEIAFVVQKGLHTWNEADALFLNAMRQIQVHQVDSLSYLKNRADKSAEIVYFDPMFETKIDSPGLAGMRHYACHFPVTAEHITEASRIATRAVVLKDHFKSSQFAKYGFTVQRRQHAAFQYGRLDVSQQ
ncbi:hypothetical protein JOC54_000961 [Alkalihalobacillus xiaoxiensis]|uniref:SAM-dependent methyltransferase n=1 Tax=Shouchella xiaoxiensis TaxID=766895 RepID=A0ABS2SQE6_9BACI|nr:hypothetical protein [Shouchella xiaoxiensis]